MVWQSNVRSRVAFFSWTTALGKILTIYNLRNRHIIVLNWCYLCNMCGELVDHLLLYCPIAYELWSMVCCLFSIHWVMTNKIFELLVLWQGKFGRHRNIDFWRFVQHCLFWSLWREWNDKWFKDCEWSILDLKSFFFHTLLEWSLVLPSCPCLSFPILVDHFNLSS